MKKTIEQSDGLNQVALINSKNNQVTIINSPIEYMSYLMQKGKIDEAVELLAKLHKETEKLHPLYPLYVYKPVELGSKIVFEHQPANKEIAEQYPLQFKGKFSIKNKDFQGDETLGEYLTRKYISQEKISIDVKYIETWIGEQLIDDPISFEKHAVNGGEWFMLPKELPSPMKAKLVLTEKIDRVIIDYLELRVTEINNKEDKIIISNIHQENSPLILSLVIPNIFKENVDIATSKFNITIRNGFEGKVIAEKIFLEFMKSIGNSSKMSLIDIESQRLFFTAESINIDNPLEFENLEGRIELLKELLKIENALKVKFQLPEMILKEDFEKIEILIAIVENKEVTSSLEDFSAIFDNKEALQKVLEIKDSPFLITAEEDQSIELFGVKFENIKVTHRFENLVVKNSEVIRKKLEYFIDGETIKVEFEPGNQNKLLTRYSIEN